MDWKAPKKTTKANPVTPETKRGTSQSPNPYWSLREALEDSDKKSINNKDQATARAVKDWAKGQTTERSSKKSIEDTFGEALDSDKKSIDKDWATEVPFNKKSINKDQAIPFGLNNNNRESDSDSDSETSINMENSNKTRNLEELVKLELEIKPNRKPITIDTIKFKQALINALEEWTKEGTREGYGHLVETEKEYKKRNKDPQAKLTTRPPEARQPTGNQQS